MEEKRIAESLNGIWDSLTDEQKEKAKACKTMDELIKLAGEEGIELPDEMLDSVSGGKIIPVVANNPLPGLSKLPKLC